MIIDIFTSILCNKIQHLFVSLNLLISNIVYNTLPSNILTQILTRQNEGGIVFCILRFSGTYVVK